MAARLVYLHGFASSPRSEKAVFFRERFAQDGHALNLLDLNAPSFRALTLTRSVQKLESAVPAGTTALVLGSSFGGYAAALFASRHPDRMAALMLMAPAFNMATLLRERYGAQAVRLWRKFGTTPVEHPDYEVPQKLDATFLDDADRWAARSLQVQCPTLVFHGEQDEDVPIRHTEEFLANHPQAELVRLPTGHALTDDKDEMWTRTRAFFAPWLG